MNINMSQPQSHQNKVLLCANLEVALILTLQCCVVAAAVVAEWLAWPPHQRC